ncbi:MAG: hypothetical protein HC879_16110 [Leptolyngbyaceae cyanobacterium SL_5_9]|nr:hypothetical protein [Leptolyngbyaceae cyanobacterium SL_5_9]
MGASYLEKTFRNKRLNGRARASFEVVAIAQSQSQSQCLDSVQIKNRPTDWLSRLAEDGKVKLLQV